MKIVRNLGLLGIVVSIGLSLWFFLPTDSALAAVPITANISSARFETVANGAVIPNVVVVQFSNHVWGPSMTALTTADFVYTDGNSAGMSAITSVYHTAGNNWAVLTMDNAAVAGDTADNIAAAEGRIFTIASALPGPPLSNTGLTDNAGNDLQMRIYAGLGNASHAISQAGSSYVLMEFQMQGDSSSSTFPAFGPGGISAANPIGVPDIYHNNIPSISGIAVSNVTHTPGDHFAALTMAGGINGGLILTELGLDVFDCAATVTDAWGKPCVQTAGVLTADSGAGNFIIYNSQVETAVADQQGLYEMWDTGRAASEPIYGSGGVFTSMLTGDFGYGDGNGIGATAVSGVNHVAGNHWFYATFNNPVVAGDLNGTDITGTPGATDLFSNAFAGGPANLIDLVTPVIISAHTTGDDQLDIVFSEYIGTATIGSILTNSGATGFTGIDTSGSPTITWSGSGLSWNTDATGLSVGTGTDYTGVNRAVVPNITTSAAISDGSGNQIPAYTNYSTTQDGTGPILLNTIPSDTAENIALDQVISMTFSEAMNTGFAYGAEFTVSPNPGGWLAPVWTNANRTVTLAHSNFNLSTTYSVNTDETQIDAASGAVTALDIVNSVVNNDWSFNAVSGRRSGGGMTDLSVVINDQANQTTTTQVSLTLTGINIDQMLLANDDSFQGAVWEPFQQTKNWTLTPGNGTKTVYVMFKHLSGDISPTVSDSIDLISADDDPINPPIDDTTPPVNDTTPPIGDWPEQYMDGRWVKIADYSTVYFLGLDNIRHIYPTQSVWESYFGNDFSFVEIISPDELAGYPLGHNIPFAPGTLMKFNTVPNVYLVESDGVIRWIVSEAVATTHFGNNWATLVYDMPEAFINDYTRGSDLSQ